MPASIHPAVQLHIVLDEETYEGGDSVEMARRFAAVAPTEVVRASKGSQRSNVLRFDLSDDAVVERAGGDAVWRDALTAWLDEEFDETSALVARENDARRNNGQRAVPFQWAEVKFGMGPVIAIRMKGSAIPAEAAGYVARARTLLVQGAFGADPVSAIRIPACAAIEVQRAESEAADIVRTAEDDPRGSHAIPAKGVPAEALKDIGREERSSTSASDIVAAVDEAARFSDDSRGWAAADPDAQNAWASSSVQRDEPTRADIEAAVAEAEEALRRGDDPTDAGDEPMMQVVEVEAGQDDDATSVDRSSSPADEAHDRGVAAEAHDRDGAADARDLVEAEEACALSSEDVPDDLDYRVWNIAYADGTSVRFDSVLGEALLD